MSNQTQAIGYDLSRLAEDATALIAATADVAGDEVGKARERLAAGLERGRKLYGQARHQAEVSAKAADVAIHRNPYQVIAIGVGVGALFGYLLAHRCTRLHD